MNPPSAIAETARHDLYRDIHKGLRVALFDTVRRLGRLEPDDAEPLQRTLDLAQRLLALLASHVKQALRPREVAQLLRTLPSKVPPEAVDALLAPLRDRVAPEAS